MNVIEINALGKSFHHVVNHRPQVFWAFQDISFNVKQGERVGIIGSNGSGKSTLLRVLARIIAPTTGRACLRGRVGSIIEIGSGFHPELTGRENIFLNGVIMGMEVGTIRKQFDRIVNFAGIEGFIDTPVKYYSSGMYLRLAFSIAAHLDVDIFLLDEVIAVGDEAFQKRCSDKLVELSSKGCTLLTVSHDLVMVQQLCDKVVLMEKSRLVIESYDVKDVIKRYKS
jgi:lipopolysaccharide transport system ATP-binding protein